MRGGKNVRGAGRCKINNCVCILFYQFPPSSLFIWRAGRPTSVGEIDEITLDAAKAYTAEQGEEEYERIGEWWPDWIVAEKQKCVTYLLITSTTV